MNECQPLTVFVPLPAASAGLPVAAGSALVGCDDGSERVVIDFEGAIYHQDGMQRFADRVLHAAGRATTTYPTSARLALRRDQLLAIGTWNEASGELIIASRAAERALARWLGADELDPDELRSSAWRYEQRRSLAAMESSADPRLRAAARLLRRRSP